MAMVGLIGGTLAGGSGLRMLMTWLETSLQKAWHVTQPSTDIGPAEH